MAQEWGLKYNWICFDGLYGDDPAFLRYLDDMEEAFMGDIHKDQHLYLQDPYPTVPARKSARGRKPTRPKEQTEPISVDRWAEQQSKDAWKKIAIRDTTKSKLKVEVLHRRVWHWVGQERKAHHWHLIVRREIGSKDIKYSLSNAPEDTPVKRLAYM